MLGCDFDNGVGRAKRSVKRKRKTVWRESKVILVFAISEEKEKEMVGVSIFPGLNLSFATVS